MALPLALIALVVIGAAVAGAFSLAHLEQRVGRNVMYAVQASSAAEAGAVAALAGWDGLSLGALSPGAAAVLPSGSLPGPSAWAATVTRLNGELFLVRVEGSRLDAQGGLLARRVVSVVVRAAEGAPPGWPPVAPLAHRAWDRSVSSPP
ncbi:MAG TPA: hypothetical protein VFV66_19590 [Nonomuraea sp.]|nr:hypothetical protein [Nonomuraea sp.]